MEDIEEMLNGDKEFTVITDVRKNLIVVKIQTDEKEYIDTINGDDAIFFKFIMKMVSQAIVNKQENNNARSDEE